MAGEQKLQQVIVEHLAQARVLAVKCDAGVRGWPDLTCVGHGKVCFIEVKNPNKRGKVSVFQEIMHDRLKKQHGAQVYVIDSIEQLKEIIEWFHTH